jgi:hypothetical protein
LAACGAAPNSTAVQSRAQIDAPDLVAFDDPPAFEALAGQPEVLALARTIAGLSPSVDPAEAARAAALSYSHTAALALEYEITDPPLLHNFKVNRGIKPRGLCWHWAEDMETRLKAENFQTLDLHRAIANHDNSRIDHSTAIISAKGDTMFDGVVVDPWRKGGTLTWVKVLEDKRYRWRPRAEVLAYYAARDGA